MVSNVEAESSNAPERKESKKQKKTGPQYDCTITCLDGTVINTSVEVKFYFFSFHFSLVVVINLNFNTYLLFVFLLFLL